MTNAYRAVQWNAHKRTYDLVLLAAALAMIAGFVGASVMMARPADDLSPEILVIRALGATAGSLLSVTLCIGPLARLDRRFAPLLYNRRHLGVTTAALATLHGLIATNWYHGFGALDPLVSVLSSGSEGGGVPFQPLGLAALVVLLVMASTSHDFWLHNLGPRQWKRLHMLVYPAWLLMVAHVAFGAMQTDATATVLTLLAVAVALVGGLHVTAGFVALRADARPAEAARDGWLDAGPAHALPDGGAVRVCRDPDHPIAVFRDGDAVSALAGVCAHQGGPLAEGRLVDGCVTCPWHGYQYRPQDGQSPPPYTEKLHTHRVRIRDGRVEVDPDPQPPGTHLEPARIPS